MDVRVFLSCTRGDLDLDCRDYVLRVIRTHALPLDMDDWVVDSSMQSPEIVELCQRMIRDDASHYLGLFAYRRGWVPNYQDLGDKSITEAEFDWAQSYNKLVAVFLPKPTSRFAEVLRQRASEQSEEDANAQKVFLERVRRESNFMEFEDPGHLVTRATTTITSWSGGGLRSLLNKPKPVTKAPLSFEGLGRSRHFHAFEQSVQVLSTPGIPRQAAFLIHGPLGFGHEAFSQRIGQTLATANPPPKQVELSFGVAWRSNDIGSVCSLIGRQLGQADCRQMDDLIRLLDKILDAVDVVINAQMVHRFSGDFAGFVTSCWQPLVRHLDQRKKRRLFATMTLEQNAAPQDWDQVTQPPLEFGKENQFTPELPIAVPKLDELTAGEIALWLRQWKDEDESLNIAQRLIDETNGHPAFVHQRLGEASLWQD